jgi:tetratricopeptide (TPR) repeat protein
MSEQGERGYGERGEVMRVGRLPDTGRGADPERHLSADALWRFMTGGLPPAETRGVLVHLLQACPQCQAAARAVWNLPLRPARSVGMAAGSGADRPAGRALREMPPVYPGRAAAGAFRGEPSGECRMSTLDVRRPASHPGEPAMAAGSGAGETPLAADASAAQEAAGSSQDLAYDAVLDRVFSRITVQEAAIAAARQRARGLFEELVQHPPARQHLLVHNSARFRDPMLCENLLAASFDEGFRDPARARQLARLAVMVVERLAAAVGAAPELPQLSNRLQLLETRETPATPEAPQTRHAAETSQTSHASQSLRTFQVPQSLQTPRAPQPPQAPPTPPTLQTPPAPPDGELDLLAGLRARAWAQLGNALRITSDLDGAAGAFGSAEAVLAAHPRLSPLDEAKVLDLKASLCRDVRQLAEAERLLDRVIAIYRRCGQSNLVGRALSQKALVLREAGDARRSMVLLRRALELLDPHEDPVSVLNARHNLILALVDDGRPREAFALLFHTRPLYLKMGDRMTLLRLRWREGLVAQGLRRLEQAEAAFREVRDAYVELGIAYDAALVSLDLAAVLAQQGRTADLRQLAQEMLTVFESHQIHREAMAAFLVFCDAARIEQAGLRLVKEVATFLEKARNAPGLRFTPGG